MRVQQFIDHLSNVKRYSPHTLAAYKRDLLQFLRFCEMKEGESDFSKITPKVVRRWLMAEMNGGLRVDLPGKRLCAASGRRKLSSVRAFFRFLVKEGALEVSPVATVNGPKAARKLPLFLEEEKMDELLDERLAGSVNFSDLRDRLIVLVLYDTGIRRSEIIALRVDDVDFARRVIRVYGKGGKQREVPMIAELVAAIACYLEMRKEVVEPEHGWLFVTNAGNPVGTSFVYRVTKKYLSEVTTLSRRGPHVLRHTCATHLLHRDASLQGIKELLGHSSLAATQVYTHNSIEHILKIFKQAHPRA
ncbi:MAG: tyrosine-type recombinase/integrase [Odoribacteraceae bacterium]|jgi:integrase/recombinase XerC|nr:tyrosine-type recombinase/integrase [Odoribacteraceae bacterium]